MYRIGLVGLPLLVSQVLLVNDDLVVVFVKPLIGHQVVPILSALVSPACFRPSSGLVFRPPH